MSPCLINVFSFVTCGQFLPLSQVFPVTWQLPARAGLMCAFSEAQEINQVHILFSTCYSYNILGGLKYSEESDIHSLPHAWAHGNPWLSSVCAIDRWETAPWEHSQPSSVLLLAVDDCATIGSRTHSLQTIRRNAFLLHYAGSQCEKFNRNTFLLQFADSKVRIWQQQDESMSCVNILGWWWWCSVVGNIFVVATGHLNVSCA